jgi:hypothetical protein
MQQTLQLVGLCLKIGEESRGGVAQGGGTIPVVDLTQRRYEYQFAYFYYCKTNPFDCIFATESRDYVSQT